MAMSRMTEEAEEIREAAFAFLETMAGLVEDRIGANPVRTQESVWLVEGPDGSYSSSTFTREVLDRGAIWREWQLLPRDGTLEQKMIHDVLLEAGIKNTRFGYLSPLGRRWLQLEQPLPFNRTAAADVVDEFVNAVTTGVSTERSRDVFDMVEIKGGPLLVGPGLELRPISEDDLWEFGDTEAAGHGPLRDFPPGTRSAVLEIRVDDRTKNDFDLLHATREAAHVALRLAAPGRLQLRPYGVEKSYGTPGRLVRGGYGYRQLDKLAASNYVVDEAVRNRLQASWIPIQEIMKSQQHYLRLPAQRLLDAGQRNRPDDAVIDYAVGLESLLTHGVRNELGYRFALRGSILLEKSIGARKALFKQLRDFYVTRSDLVHGESVKDEKTRNARVLGERVLRTVWWSFFDRDPDSVKPTLKDVDDSVFK
jgi:hypothetical protein